MDHDTSTGNKGIPMSMLALGAAVIIAAGAIWYINTNSQKEMAQLPKEQAAATQAEPTAAMMKDKTSGDAMESDSTMMKKGSYKDGTYEATGHYESPGGEEEIEVSITVKDGTVTDTSTVSKATNPKSVMMQGVFIDNYKAMVVGKSLDEVKLDKVAGSSLTPKGFNDAVEQIKKEAVAS